MMNEETNGQGGQPGGAPQGGGGEQRQPAQQGGGQSGGQHNQGGGGGQGDGGRRRRRRRGGRGRGQGGGGQQGGGNPQQGQRQGGQNWGGGNRQQQQNGGGNRMPQVPQAPQKSDVEAAYSALTPVDPFEWFQLEKGSTDPSMRALDLLAPIGKGTRGLIVAPPKAGKTTFLKQVSNAVHAIDPKVIQYCLLVDERPEEVTDFKRSVPAEVWASSSDQTYQQHKKIAEDLFKTALQKVVEGHDVFILLDSLTRLARVYNQFATGARTMSGGLDSRAMEIPRRFFGAARKLEGAGSLTILATILVDTGSKMDDIIFQEFKGTGNMELVLYRQAAEMRIFPALKVRDSGTRKEEKLFPPDVLEGVYRMRRALAGAGDIEAIKGLTELMRVHKTNKALLESFK
ncbi:MAG: transcription termination factor Rho [Elusimicrobiota bacterium]|nr:MAG: transcription termination factor Rho [Elusimicrobiota bacterium]